MQLKKPQFDYKWVILIVCFLMEFLCLGFCSSNAGLYTKAVTEALNIKRSAYSLTTSIRYVAQVIAALYFGTLINRFGVKKMVFCGMAGLTASVAIRAFATEIYHFYIGGVLWGAGIVFCGGTMASTIVRRWFHKDVGKYTGIVMSANGIGGATAAQIITPLINNGETFGYRTAYLVSAVISLAITIIIMVFLRENPSDGPAIQGTDGKKKPKGNVAAGLPYEVIRKKPYFYATIALVFLTGISIQSIESFSVVYLSDVGLPANFIATVVTISSLFMTVSKIFIGAVYDKKGLRFTMMMCLSAAIIGFMLKTLLNNSIMGMVLAMIIVLLMRIAAPLETVMIPLLTGDLFGASAYNKTLGIFMAANSLGLCLGSPLGDLYFDIFGTYKPCFWFFSALMALVAAGYFFVIRAARKDQAAMQTETA